MHMHMPAQQHSVHQNHMIENPAVVRHMRPHHEKTAVPDNRIGALLGTPMDCHVLPNHIPLSDHDPALGPLIGQILRLRPDHGSNPDPVFGP
jgi:hypothetical protein